MSYIIFTLIYFTYLYIVNQLHWVFLLRVRVPIDFKFFISNLNN